jgi:2,3-bisphosphoglycerate-independent phosphoglycerate mutase
VELVNHHLRSEFPDFELFHNSDFRNTLVVRNTWVKVDHVGGPEPHESHGEGVDPACLVTGSDPLSAALAERLNRYLVRSAELLRGQRADMLYPWSPSRAFRLPPFREVSGFAGRAAVVANMDFLHGIARAGGIEFFKHGTGRPDTDYAGKGRRLVELLDAGYELVVCHVNAPDEAAHMGDVELKIETLEAVDRHVMAPLLAWFEAHPDELGGVMVAPDHYTNVKPEKDGLKRMEVHSMDPVPFALWNGRDRDAVERFDEDAAPAGRWGAEPVSHLELLDLLLGRTAGVAAGEPVAP